MFAPVVGRCRNVGTYLTAAWAASCIGAALLPAAAFAAPQQRAYEMVSPPNKGNSDVDSLIETKSAVSGDAFIFGSTGAFAGPQSNSRANGYRSVRGSDGWTAEAITPPGGPYIFTTFPMIAGMSEDVSSAVVTSNEDILPDAPRDVVNLYRRAADGSLEVVTTAAPTDPFLALIYKAPAFVAGSSDFGHILIQSQPDQFFQPPFPLTPDAPAVSNSVLYEWVDGRLRLAAILPDGTPAPNDSAAAAPLGQETGVISEDGSRVFFTTDTNLYVREDGTTTTLIGNSATFVQATSDGSKVLYFDSGGAGSLYQYDVDTRARTLVSVDSDGGDGNDPRVQGALGQSADGSTVYFVARGRLVPGRGTSGGNNLYAWRDGVVRFITVLGGSLNDAANWGAIQFAQRFVSPNGRYVAFVSDQSLTGYNNNGTTQYYIYDYETAEVRCATCNPTGEPATATPSTHAEIQIETFANKTNALTDEGRLFFATSERLLSDDVNDQVDVYEYHYEDESLGLISTGRSSSPSRFLDASESGDTVFFTTRERLVGWDVDNSADVYAARVGGGFPEPPPPPPPPCTGDACQGPPQPPLVPSTPSSISFSGPGDVDEQLEAPSVPVFRVATISSRQRRILAERGRVKLSIAVSDAGTVDARARARIGRRTSTVAKASRTAPEGGLVRLTLRLSRAARARLRRTNRLRLTIAVAYSQSDEQQTTTFTLKRETRKSRRAGRKGGR